MYVKSLYLRNFRNYTEAEVHFSPQLNLFYGDNAQGKTNLLEAIYLIATGRSFRTTHLSELIRAGEPFFFLEAKVCKEGFEHTVQVSFDGQVKRLVLDGNSYATLQHLLGLLPAVFYTPCDAELVHGAPSVRRRFINLHLAQRDPLYIHHLARYWRAMKQRNALLRSSDVRGIECWESEMAGSASYIGKARSALFEELKKPFGAHGRILSGEREEHEVRFHTSVEPSAEGYLAQLHKHRPRERQLKFTLTGPHRDDFEIWINAKAAGVFASEGQKRSSAFGLRLAEWDLFTESSGAPALLGIDDLNVHLDPGRLALFRRSLDHLGQVFVTAPELGDYWQNATRFRVAEGSVLV